MNKNLKILLNVAILLLVAGFVWYMAASLNKEESGYADVQATNSEPFVSDYKKERSFDLPEKINRFELCDDKLFISAGQSVYITDTDGAILRSFPVKLDVRDIAAGEGKIYLLYPTFIEVYTHEGEQIHGWEACSNLSDYCSFTFAGDYVFVTDAENKNICKYTQEGNFVKFINSPMGFIIPSYSFDIENRNDTIYCANSGRHLIETYTLNGDFISAFGGPGGEAGFFAGCCNPSYISFTPGGDLFTSEKGNPRISCFTSKGKFKKMMLNSKLLGGGSNAYEVKAREEKLFVAGKNTITVFRYEGNEKS